MSKKKDKPMSDLDLDFNDIVQSLPEEPQKETLSKPKKISSVKIDEYNLALCYGKKIKLIELNSCSNEDFLSWVYKVFPASDREPEAFERKDIRIRVLKNVIQFHRTSLQWLRSQQKEIIAKPS